MPLPPRDSRGRFVSRGSGSSGGGRRGGIIDVELRGEIEARQKIEQVITDLNGRPFYNAMMEAALIVEGSAKRKAPVDRGQLRQSIASEVRTSALGAGDRIIGVVGSNRVYAAAVEFGSRPHWAPIEPLKVWARRHGANAYAVQRAIARRGTRAQPYLVPAFEENKLRIVRILGDGVKGIVRK